jgi:hypothetical protein
MKYLFKLLLLIKKLFTKRNAWAVLSESKPLKYSNMFDLGAISKVINKQHVQNNRKNTRGRRIQYIALENGSNKSFKRIIHIA